MVDMSIRIGGVAGAGVSVTALILARILKEHGYHIQTFRDIPSRIRGGHTSETIRISDKPSFSPPSEINLLIAFDKDSITKYSKMMAKDGYILVDIGTVKSYDKPNGANFLEIPASKLAKEKLGSDLYRNTIIVGFIAEMYSLDKSTIRGVLSRIYGRKGEKIVNYNFEALEIGANYYKSHYKELKINKIKKLSLETKRILLTGNDAIALGAIVAGCRFYAGYPITPATQILERLVNLMPRFGGVVIQTEDEIAAVNAVIGAAIAGVRSMTATSGPGFSLMSEAVSLAGMAEVPIVLVNSNRAGPSTGMPTKTEQSDLLFTIFQGHGEFPKVVIAPANAEEAFYFTVDAFNLADICQCPVVIFVDEFISHGYQTAPLFNLDKVKIEYGKVAETDKTGDDLYPRYKLTEDGISPRAFPGRTPGIFITTGLEHDEYGYPVENEEARVKMMDKRLKKIKIIREFLDKNMKSEIIGDPSSEIGLIVFGSVRGPAVEAIELLAKERIKIKILRLKYLWPFPEKDVEEFVKNSKKVIVIEMNATGQLYQLVKMTTGSSDKIVSVKKYDGRLFTPQQIAEEIMKVI